MATDYSDREIALSDALQENILTLLATSDKFCKLVKAHVPLDLYSNKIARTIAKAAHAYVHEYGTAPRDHLPDLLEDELAKDDLTSRMLRRYLANIAELREHGFNETFVVNQLEKFVRFQQVKRTIIDLAEAVDKNDVDTADKIITDYSRRSLAEFNPGLTLRDVARNVLAGREERECFNIGIPELDRHYLGPARKELHLMLAPMKRGKTWWLIHLTKQALLQQLRVAYITLEVSAQIIGVRTIQSMFAMTRSEAGRISHSMFTRKGDKVIGIDSRLISRIAVQSAEGKEKLRQEFGVGDGKKKRPKLKEYRGTIQRIADNLIIKEFPSRSLTADGLDSFLEELFVGHGFVPDVVVLDYPDLFKIATANYRLNLGALYGDLRGGAQSRNYALCAASQSNRGSLDAYTITEGHASEDISKIAISDVVMTYNQIATERSINAARLFVSVARNSADKFAVNILQSYETGQFCLESEMIDAKTYEALLPRDRGRERGMRGERESVDEDDDRD